MTPHERAKFVTAVIMPLSAGWGWQDAVTAIVEAALDAHTADLRDLLAQQAQRGDRLETDLRLAKIAQEEAYLEMVKERNRADSLRVENERLREALENYAMHIPMCSGDPCLCGLDAALAGGEHE
jgi:hypothetical protein